LSPGPEPLLSILMSKLVYTDGHNARYRKRQRLVPNNAAASSSAALSASQDPRLPATRLRDTHTGVRRSLSHKKPVVQHGWGGKNRLFCPLANADYACPGFYERGEQTERIRTIAVR
jgi:hypothetical protein